MSWDAFIQNFLIEKQIPEGTLVNCCESAGIISKISGDIWACSSGFFLVSYPIQVQSEVSDKVSTILINEAQEILKLFKSGCKPPNLQIRINKVKYEYILYNDQSNSIYFKRPKGGACISSTNLCLVIATYNENEQVYLNNEEEFLQNPGLCNDRVENLSDFLRNAGF